MMDKKISNAEFLRAVSNPSNSKYTPNILSGEYEGKLWVCSKIDSNDNWYGTIYDKNYRAIENPNMNNYFCISQVRAVDGKVRRKKENFFCMMCLVLDDVGTKAEIPDLEPSWAIETSPGNEQWGYILENPVIEELKANQLVKALIEKKYCDEGATGPSTRYMRLPVGSNDKAEHLVNNDGKPYPHKLKIWNPKLFYSVEDLINKLGLDLKENNKATPKNNDFNIGNVEKETNLELMQKIVTGENYHNSLLKLAASYVSKGIPRDIVIQILQAVMNANGDKSIRFKERYNDITRLIDTAIEKFVINDDSVDRLKPISASDFVKASPITWSVKHILPAGGLAMIFGESGSGKSFFALDIAASISRGISWCGKKVKQGKVIYIAAEGVSGFRRRIEAYCTYNDINIDDFPFKIIPETPDLTKNDDKSLITSIKNDGGADAVVIDTLAQVSAGANENSAEDMSMIIKRCQNIQKETGALVLLIHHSGKDANKGERGWSGIRGAMDTIIKITSKESHKKAEISKQKDGSSDFKINFALKQLELGLDEDKEPITSCVIELESDFLTPIPKKTKGSLQKLVLEILTKNEIMTKKDLIHKIFLHNKELGTKSRKDSITRTVNDMLDNFTLEQNEEWINITQNHNTLKNNTCVNVAKSENVTPHTHQSLEMCSGGSDAEPIYEILR